MFSVTRTALLGAVRGVNVLAARRVAPITSHMILSRHMAGGAFLNKNAVEDRVLSVIKGFDRVDPAKVSISCSKLNFLREFKTPLEP
jgi:hypothetical protein